MNNEKLVREEVGFQLNGDIKSLVINKGTNVYEDVVNQPVANDNIDIESLVDVECSEKSQDLEKLVNSKEELMYEYFKALTSNNKDEMENIKAMVKSVSDEVYAEFIKDIDKKITEIMDSIDWEDELRKKKEIDKKFEVIEDKVKNDIKPVEIVVKEVEVEKTEIKLPPTPIKAPEPTGLTNEEANDIRSKIGVPPVSFGVDDNSINLFSVPKMEIPQPIAVAEPVVEVVEKENPVTSCWKEDGFVGLRKVEEEELKPSGTTEKGREYYMDLNDDVSMIDGEKGRMQLTGNEAYLNKAGMISIDKLYDDRMNYLEGQKYNNGITEID